MVSIYLDDCIEARRLVRQLRSAGHLLYLPSELGVGGQSDELHLAFAAELGAVLATHNQQDFAPLHRRWQSERRKHGGIVLVRQRHPINSKVAALARLARLLTPEAADNQLMELALFDTDERAAAYVASLTPLA